MRYGAMLLLRLFYVLTAALLILLLAGIIVFFLRNGTDALVARYARNLPDYSSAAQYLNFLIGIPLTLVTTLMGLFVSYLFGQYTRTKDEVAILRYVDDVSQPVFAALSGIANAFLDLHHCAGLSKDAVEGLAKASGAVADDAGAEKVAQEFASRQGRIIDRFAENLGNLRQSYEQLTSSMHGASFLHAKFRRIEAHTPIAYLHGKLPANFVERNLADRLTTILDRLQHWHELTTAEDFVRAYVFLPERFWGIEFDGAAIFSPMLSLAAPIERKGVFIKGYLINVGAAYLATLYQSMPDRDAMIESFHALLTNKTTIAKKFLRGAGPILSDLALPYINKSVQELIRHPNRLIIVQTANGPVHYDPIAYGDIPQTGFVEA
ncbi:MAG TPA: hypothetical protein VG843_03860 [Rhizomicrobium sp.]|jgi:hypothetical protein|nr:hypothetical protein [Rhizomicrobium sp.]